MPYRENTAADPLDREELDNFQRALKRAFPLEEDRSFDDLLNAIERTGKQARL